MKGEAVPPIVLAGTAEQVESEVGALAVIAKQNRLLRLESATVAVKSVTAEDVEKHIFQRWDGLLRRLAE